MKRKTWLWIITALPLVGVPLVAQQARPADEPGAATATPTAESPPPAEAAESVSQDPAQPADEKLSVDNSLSFPVDI